MDHDDAIRQLRADNLAMRALLLGLLKELETNGHHDLVKRAYAEADAALGAAACSLDVDVLERFASQPGSARSHLIKTGLHHQANAND